MQSSGEFRREEADSHLFVVPAKAGTHNHRPLCLR
jgi:hypothetical protein